MAKNGQRRDIFLPHAHADETIVKIMCRNWSGLVLCLTLSLQACAQQPTTGPASIEGIVLDITTGRPIEGARVLTGRIGAQPLTNAEGRFLVPNVPPGYY